jgi:hypothetical protein
MRPLALAFILLAGCQPDPGSVPEAGTKEEPPARVLIVTDESDRMEPLAAFLEEKAGIRSTIIDYAALPESERRLPEDLSRYEALVGYIHNELNEPTELAIIDYTRSGGRFVAVHHMVSSGKAKNRYYFDFLGLAMDGIEQAREPAQPGGHYMWREPVEKTVFNLAPGHYITSHGITWPEHAPFAASDVPAMSVEMRPAITLERTEVYANVKRTDGDAKTLLLGYNYTDDRNGVTHAQATDGWIKPAGEGHVVYIQPGHFVEEFTDPDNILNQLILNAIAWQPE